MKIGIMTSNASFMDNYGAALQAYALCTQLKIWGHDPIIINYRYSTGEHEVKADYVKKRNLLSIAKYLCNGNITFRQKIEYRFSRRNRQKQAQCFRKFCLAYLPIDLTHSYSIEQLRVQEIEYDCVICGSDQVWNPLIHGNKHDPGYFLDFGPDNIKRIAYAPSFGISQLSADLNVSLKDGISKIEYLSVREKTGAEIIRKSCGIDVPIVLDPTMMAETTIWNEFDSLPDNLPERYILCYRFGEMSYVTSLVRRLARQLRLPVIELPLSMSAYGKGSTLRYDIGPDRFISLIRNADLVLTDSFHCTVFSILFHVPFYTFQRQKSGDAKNMNSRMEGLLQMLNLEDRIIDVEAAVGLTVDLDMKEQFSKADMLLEEQRLESQNYLKKALSQKGDDNAL